MQILFDAYEVLFLIFYNLIGSYGGAIIILSITFWGLGQLIANKLQPLLNKYNEYDSVVMQEARRISKDSSSQKERFIKLNALYSRYSYKPFFGIAKVVPLLLQLPFLILAYYFFSNYNDLDFQKFGPINNLLQPDQLLSRTNILPLLMTAANMLSILFAVRQPAAERKQAFLLSVFFFLLLYTQPSAVVLYWTVSNIMTLFLFMGRFFSYDTEEKNNLWCMISTFFLFLHNRRIWLFSLFSGLFIYVFYEKILYGIFDRKTVSYYVGRDVLRNVILLFIISGTVSIAYMVLNYRGKIKHIKSECTDNADWESYRLFDLFLVLLPMSIISHYIFANLALIEIDKTILYFFVVAISVVILAFSFSWLLKRTKVGLLALLFIFSWLTLLSLLPFMSNYFHWAVGPDRIYPFVILLILLGGIIYLRKKFQAVLGAVCVVAFITLPVTGYLTSQDSAPSNLQKNNLSQEIATLLKKELSYKPDIFLLTYESYVPNQVMNLYGINNKAHENYLKQVGFDVYENIYSVGTPTLASLSGVLNLTTSSANLQGNRRKYLSGDSVVNFMLKGKGYETYGILEPYLFANQDVLYDNYYPKSIYGQLSKQFYLSILSGRFRFNAFDEDQANYSSDEWLKKKREVMQKIGEKPKFMHAHSPYPGHSQNSGKCLDNEIENYEKKLALANDEMKEDIETILNSNRDAVIIVAGDHGPYLLGDCITLRDRNKGDFTREELLDRFGALLAIRWPKPLQQKKPQNINILQEIFVLVFSKVFEEPLMEQMSLNTDSYEMGPAPEGAISDGIITSGKDKNKPLYE